MNEFFLMKSSPHLKTKQRPLRSSQGDFRLNIFNFFLKRFRLSPLSVQSFFAARCQSVFRAITILGGVHRLSFFRFTVHRNIPHFVFFIKVQYRNKLNHPFSYLLYIEISFDRVPTVSLPITRLASLISSSDCSLFLNLKN